MSAAHPTAEIPGEGSALMETHVDAGPRDVRRLVGIPAVDAVRVPRLLRTLEAAFPVRFEVVGPAGCDGLDALITFDQDRAREAAGSGVRALGMAASERGSPGRSERVRLSSSTVIDARLRGRSLPDTRLTGVASLAGIEDATVLAERDGAPMWSRAGRLDLAAAAPLELDESASLRDRLRSGRCAALLPLVHLLREVTADIAWQAPTPRAAFVFDDPNLHWPTYGYLVLSELARHARLTGYHAALAMVPVDTWFSHPAATRILLENADFVSTLVHGNDHTTRELARPRDEPASVTLGGQALRRIAAFERRSGVRVSRVMVPPHEACSALAARGLARCGFDAITMTRPYPWLQDPGGSWLGAPRGAGGLVGWERTDWIAGGLPVMLRHPLAQCDPAELALRAFLNQPLILYGHHGDLAEGLGVLADATAEVDRLSSPRWSSLGDVAASCFETRRDGALLRLRMFSRRVRVDIPAGVEALAVHLPSSHGEPGAETLVVRGASRATASQGVPTGPIPVEEGASVELRLRRTDAVAARDAARRRTPAMAVARRVAGEGRDRALPVAGRIRRRVGPRKD